MYFKCLQRYHIKAKVSGNYELELLPNRPLVLWQEWQIEALSKVRQVSMSMYSVTSRTLQSLSYPLIGVDQINSSINI